MTQPIDTTAIRQRADAATNSRSIEASLGDLDTLCAEVERLRELVRHAYMEGFREGNGFMAMPEGDDLRETAMRCWEESRTKKGV